MVLKEKAMGTVGFMSTLIVKVFLKRLRFSLLLRTAGKKRTKMMVKCIRVFAHFSCKEETHIINIYLLSHYIYVDTVCFIQYTH